MSSGHSVDGMRIGRGPWDPERCGWCKHPLKPEEKDDPPTGEMPICQRCLDLAEEELGGR